MKKLMKKKVNVFGKSVPVLLLVLLGMGLVSAVLVPYLSNTITGQVTVDSPIELTLTDASMGVSIEHDPEKYSVSLHGSESFWIKTTLKNHVGGITGYLGETKIENFDGEGMTVTYSDPVWTGEVTGCGFNGDWYYYIGDPEAPLPVGDLVSTTTTKTALNLEPKTYNAASQVVPIANVMCGPLKL